MGNGRQWIQRRRNALWSKNPHCFWCGRITKLPINHHSEPDTATIDHVRSRLVPTRAENTSGRWWRGITVLACRECNQERANMELAAKLKKNPEEFYKQNGGPPADKSLLQAQGALCAAILHMIDNCERHPDRIGRNGGKKVLIMAERLRRQYRLRKRNKTFNGKSMTTTEE